MSAKPDNTRCMAALRVAPAPSGGLLSFFPAAMNPANLLLDAMRRNVEWFDRWLSGVEPN